jgi:hypothetical protein
LSLVRVSNAQELAKIDPDTGLQQIVGPSMERTLTVSAQRHFSFGSLQARLPALRRGTASRVRTSHRRLIWDVSATTLRLPGRLRASGEFGYVGRKPLGDRFTAVPVREIRGSLTRSFRSELFEAGVHCLLADGYIGQTLETLQLPSETIPTERVVGVRNQSYAGVSFIYHFKPARHWRLLSAGSPVYATSCVMVSHIRLNLGLCICYEHNVRQMNRTGVVLPLINAIELM